MSEARNDQDKPEEQRGAEEQESDGPTAAGRGKADEVTESLKEEEDALEES
jgi:hypothetical protein